MTPLAEPGHPGRTPTDTTAPTAVAEQEAAAPTYSTTNVQEEGVDEPDVVKTDGATIFTVVGQHAVRGRRDAAPARRGSPGR